MVRFQTLICAIAALLAATPGAAQQIRVMTFNVRYAEPKDGANRWEARRPLAAAVIAHARPDVIGTQELLQRQGDDLAAALPGYRWFGRDRRGAHDDEHMGIFYRPATLTLVRRGDFWLSDTPDRPGSMSWGVDLPRMASWGVFETKGKTPRRFLFLDTHFAHRDQDDAARTRAAALIVSRLPALARGLPVVLAGDLNGEPDSAAHATFARAMTDVWGVAGSGPGYSYHGFTGRAAKRIDYLFVRGFLPVAASVIDDHRGAVYPSDHYPIVATLRFGGATGG